MRLFLVQKGGLRLACGCGLTSDVVVVVVVVVVVNSHCNSTSSERKQDNVEVKNMEYVALHRPLISYSLQQCIPQRKTSQPLEV